MCSCHSIPECCVMFSEVKLSIGSFVLVKLLLLLLLLLFNCVGWHKYEYRFFAVNNSFLDA